MKILVKVLIAWGMLYLLGSFYAVSFDISQWTATARQLCVLFAGIAAVSVVLDHQMMKGINL